EWSPYAALHFMCPVSKSMWRHLVALTPDETGYRQLVVGANEASLGYLGPNDGRWQARRLYIGWLHGTPPCSNEFCGGNKFLDAERHPDSPVLLTHFERIRFDRDGWCESCRALVPSA